MAYTLKIDNLRLGEFDLGGVLYHANYFHLYEMAREGLLREGKLPYSQLVENSQHLAIVESHQTFPSPILYGQPLEVLLTTSDLKRSSVVFSYEIKIGGKTVHTAWTKNVFIENTGFGFKVQSFPEKLKAIFERYLSE